MTTFQQDFYVGLQEQRDNLLNGSSTISTKTVILLLLMSILLIFLHIPFEREGEDKG